MTLKQIFTMMVAGLLFVLGVAHISVSAQGLELVGLLTKQLDVTEQQAEGGAGSLFQMAKDNLSSDDFSKIAAAVPGMESMLGAAPAPEESSGFLGAISSVFGGAEKLEGMSALNSSFEKLGLSSDMVGLFMPIVLDYVKEKGGDDIMNLLKSALV